MVLERQFAHARAPVSPAAECHTLLNQTCGAAFSLAPGNSQGAFAWAIFELVVAAFSCVAG